MGQTLGNRHISGRRLAAAAAVVLTTTATTSCSADTSADDGPNATIDSIEPANLADPGPLLAEDWTYLINTVTRLALVRDAGSEAANRGVSQGFLTDQACLQDYLTGQVDEANALLKHPSVDELRRTGPIGEPHYQLTEPPHEVQKLAETLRDPALNGEAWEQAYLRYAVAALSDADKWTDGHTPPVRQVSAPQVDRFRIASWGEMPGIVAWLADRAGVPAPPVSDVYEQGARSATPSPCPPQPTPLGVRGDVAPAQPAATRVTPKAGVEYDAVSRLPSGGGTEGVDLMQASRRIGSVTMGTPATGLYTRLRPATASAAAR